MRNPNLVKTGRLAKRAGVLCSTIRFYVKLGLLEPVDYTPGGYHLFDGLEALRRLRAVQQLKEQERLTLAEINQRLVSGHKFGDDGTEAPK